jgi:hypothetical protein
VQFAQRKNGGDKETAVANGSKTLVSGQWLGKHIPIAADTHATILVLLETMSSTWSMQRCYKEENWGK